MNKKLEKFAKLKDNWNGYDAKTFDKNYLQQADDFIKKLSKKPEIFPLADGSVQLEYRTVKYYIEIELNKDGTMLILEIKNDKDEITYNYKNWNLEIVNSYLEKL